MDDHEESILIPVREYENYRNILSLQDKQSVIRDLQHLLITKDEDLKRYKEKWEQTELVLKRTQKALDKRIQTEQTQISLPLRPISRPQPGSIQLTRPVARTRPQPAAGVQVISRALGEVDPIKSDMPSASLPHQASRPNFMDDTSSLKSLPLNLGIGTPGMSTALLRRLVQENLKLKQHFDRGQNPKASKNAVSLERINELKQKLEEQEKIIGELSNTPGNEGKQAILASLTDSQKQVQEQLETINMDKIVIESLKEENSRVKREKEDIEGLIAQYRQFETTADENNDKILELERKLRESIESRKSAESKNEVFRAEIETTKQQKETIEQERDLIQQNFQMLVSQYNTAAQPAFTRKAAGPPSPMVTQAQVSPGYGMSQSYMDPSRYQTARGQHMTQPQPMQSRPKSPYSSQTQQQQQPGLSAMSQSYTTGASNVSHQPPQPTGRKTFKCPRCDKVFNLLQEYRGHIKICLNS